MKTLRWLLSGMMLLASTMTFAMYEGALSATSGHAAQLQVKRDYMMY